MSQFGTRARNLFERAFPERQIYHRSGGSVRYVSLSPSKQVLLALGAVGIAGWCAYATVNVVLSGQMMAQQDHEVERLEQKYERFLRTARAREAAARAQLEERTVAFDRATEEFERRHETLKLLLDFAGGSSLSASARPVNSDGDKVLMQASIEEADARESRSSANAQAYQVQTVSFRGRIEKLRDEQNDFLTQAEDNAVKRTEEIRGVLRMTGVGFTRLTAADGGVGGPEIPIVDVSAVLGDNQTDPEFSQRVRQVAARVTEARRLQQLVNVVPLGPPVGVDYRETSGYGIRRDPFTGRTAFHSGLDFAAFQRAPVISTSPGEVTFANVKSGYGYTVEVDHGFGFKTRYAHLDKINVTLGQKVVIGQTIGLMGSTGRSTGTHLHYEVWFRDKPYDPINFLRAGRYRSS
ncbi:MAG: peptidoglycan DD-metalloendopeptidase family protein [Caulobacterales bacterium]|jgi:murein DD-endopeptidase MepM/ murein hydrolase activator NlpD